jgi:hypothetical protein
MKSRRSYLGNAMKVFFNKRFLTMPIVIGLLFTLFDCSPWIKVSKGVIGKNVEQDFSKENLMFTITPDVTATGKINIVQTKPLAKAYDDFVFKTEIHYDMNHYLLLKKCKTDGTYKYKIRKRK